MTMVTVPSHLTTVTVVTMCIFYNIKLAVFENSDVMVR